MWILWVFGSALLVGLLSKAFEKLMSTSEEKPRDKFDWKSVRLSVIEQDTYTFSLESKEEGTENTYLIFLEAPNGSKYYLSSAMIHTIVVAWWGDQDKQKIKARRAKNNIQRIYNELVTRGKFFPDSIKLTHLDTGQKYFYRFLTFDIRETSKLVTKSKAIAIAKFLNNIIDKAQFKPDTTREVYTGRPQKPVEPKEQVINESLKQLPEPDPELELPEPPTYEQLLEEMAVIEQEGHKLSS